MRVGCSLHIVAADMDGLIRRIGWLPLAGVLIALMPTMTLWRRNMDRLGYEHALPTILFVAAAAGLITALIYLFVRSGPRAGIFAAIIAAFVFYSVPAASVAPGKYGSTLALVLALGLAVAVARRVPSGTDAQVVNGKLNLVLIPVVAATLTIGGYRQWVLESARPQIAHQFAPFEGRASANAPDVWHLLFDRYASRETLEQRYDFDNRPFLDELRKRGFAVGETKYSNYQRTGHSVAATLNGASLDHLAGAMVDRQSDWLPIYRAINDNRALSFFAENGYRTIFAGTWWSPTRQVEAGETINYRSMPELGRKLLDQSIIGLALRQLDLPFGDGRLEQCRREKLKFDRLEQLAAEPGRKYVFAHFLVPHPPFVLSADGTCRPLVDAMASSRRDNYVAQVRFANAGALRLIDRILAGPRPAVIVIHSDEGPWPEPYVGNEHALGGDPVSVDWARLDGNRLREKFGILLAVRAPSGPPRTMPDSPVQIYPAILIDHFGSRMPLPPSRHEVFESDHRLYTFRDVSTKLGAAQLE
jgi:hypothetical protein